MHTNVSEVSKGYLSDADLLHDRPRNLLSATESVAPRKSLGVLLRTFLELSFFPSQVPDDVASISGVSDSRSAADRTAF